MSMLWMKCSLLVSGMLIWLVIFIGVVLVLFLLLFIMMKLGVMLFFSIVLVSVMNLC